MKVLAFDPGVTTGVACLIEKDGEAEVVWTEEIGMWYTAETKIRIESPDVLVVEDFRLYPGKAKFLGYNDMPSAQVIGVLKYLAAKYDIPLVLQMAHIKEHVPADLKEIKGDHMRDAVRHGVYYLAQQPKEGKE